mmetsp:Transcript_9700/g.10656  ORF Transcript_9700/g.10656 Transcript_9700/m.10656 type:complete len:380 (+) Transcript_9700:76-1215(+)
MFSPQLARKRAQEEKSFQTRARLKKISQQARKTKRDNLSEMSRQRKDQWVLDHINTDLHATLVTGHTNLNHPSQYQFRNESRAYNLHEHEQPFRISYYLPMAQRASKIQESFDSTHLEKEPFDSSPVRSFRPFDPTTITDFKFTDGDNRSRIKTAIQKNSRGLNSTNRTKSGGGASSTGDLRNVFERKPHPRNWVSPRNFQAMMRTSSSKMDSPWATINNYDRKFPEPYNEGLEKLGDVSRKRLRSLEIAEEDFDSTTREGEYFTKATRSLRSYKSEKTLSNLSGKLPDTVGFTSDFFRNQFKTKNRSRVTSPNASMSSTTASSFKIYKNSLQNNQFTSYKPFMRSDSSPFDSNRRRPEGLKDKRDLPLIEEQRRSQLG